MMQRMPGRVRLRDVAVLAETSTKTASRVINDDPRVSSATRARVRQAVTALGYRPDPLARSLRLGTDATIGVVVDEVGDPFFASAIGAIEGMALDDGITVIIASTRRLPDRERIVVDGLLQRRVAGLLVASICQDHAHLRASPCPVVFIDRHPVGLAADAVLVDDHAGARLGVDHLIARGHRRIAYVGDPPAIDTTRLRLEGYQASLAAAGIPLREDYVVTLDPSLADSHPLVTQLLALEQPPTAVFSASTRCSLRVLVPLHQTGRTDVAFVSFGDFATAQALTPPVTVIDHSPELIGRLAAGRLLRRMAGEDLAAETITVPLRVVQRGSGEIAP